MLAVGKSSEVGIQWTKMTVQDYNLPLHYNEEVNIDKVSFREKVVLSFHLVVHFFCKPSTVI